MNLRQRTPQFTRYLLCTHSQTPVARVLVSTLCTQSRAGQKTVRQTPISITRSFHSSCKASASPTRSSVSNGSNKTISSTTSSKSNNNNYPTNTRNNISEAPKSKSKPKRESSPIKLWPFLAILVGGTLLFNQLLKTRAGTQPPKEGAQIASGPLNISK